MIYFLVEEPSIVPVIDAVMGIVAPESPYKVIPHQGKDQLRIQLPKVVPTLGKVPDARLMVVQDQDRSDCRALKKELLSLCGPTEAPLLVRIPCQELEAWFLGDLNAVGRAYPRFHSPRWANRAQYRNIDELDKPSDELKRIVPELATLPFLPKREVARAIAPHLSPLGNASKSFQAFVQGIRLLSAARA